MTRVKVIKPMSCTDSNTGKMHILPVGFRMYHPDKDRVKLLVEMGYLEIISQPTDVSTDPPPLRKIGKSQVPSYPYQQSFSLN